MGRKANALKVTKNVIDHYMSVKILLGNSIKPPGSWLCPYMTFKYYVKSFLQTK